jgi:ubiquinone/menaquinone biosynthesis C-methylase UbiE
MHTKLSIFVSPDKHEELFKTQHKDHLFLSTKKGKKYNFVDGFANLIFPKALEKKVKTTVDFYENRAEVYDQYLYQTFKTHNEDEITTRNKFIDLLNIKSTSKVLEIACGTGRDSDLIARRLTSGQLVMQDIAPSMLKICKKKLAKYSIDKDFCLSNAMYLPFADNYFDATYSFGGLGEFPDIKKCLAEMVRVTKVGGKIVVGDESMPPWLRNTYFSKILSTTNPQFLVDIPLKDLPVEARKVKLQWVIGGVFYLIDFEVGVGEPKGNFDYEIEGPRGGTLRTRVEGQLEGVTIETKNLAYKAAKNKGVSLHSWLDKAIKSAAKNDLKE